MLTKPLLIVLLSNSKWRKDMRSLLQRRWLGPVAVALIINHAYGAPAPRRCEQVLSGLGVSSSMQNVL